MWAVCAAPQRALAMAMTLPSPPHLHPPSRWSAFWLMDFRNQLSMAAWFVLRAGYLFLRTAKCHRLCGDSINQSPRIINNQRELERDSNTEWALPWPDTSSPARWLRWRFWKIANQRNRKEFRELQLTSTSIRAMCQKQRKFLDCCSPLPPSTSSCLYTTLWNFDELHGELCSDNCRCPCQRQIVLLLSFAGHLIAPIVGSHDSI